MFTKKKQKVHLIIKDHLFRFVETTQPNLQEIKSFGERYLPSGVIREGKIIERETLIMILSEVINDQRLRGRSVQFCVPDAYVVVRKLNIPSDIPEDEIKGFLFLEIGETIHLPFDDALFDFSIINHADQGTEIVLVASPRNIVEDYISVIKEAKLKPIVADLSSLSIYRLLKSLDISDLFQEHLMLIQFDIRSVNVTIFHQDIPQFTRHLKMNLEHEKWEVDRGENDDVIFKWTGDPNDVDGQLQEIMTEIERLLSFYRFSVNKGRSGVTKLFLTGDYPNMTELVNRMARIVDVPVEQLPASIAITRSGEYIPTRYYELVGLSLKQGVET